jgi:hypothetical protein
MHQPSFQRYVGNGKEDIQLNDFLADGPFVSLENGSQMWFIQMLN